MRAVVMRAFGSPEVLEVDDVQDPVPAAGEVLVRVGAVEVSSTRDLGTRSGHHPFSQQVVLPHVLGGDFAGVVESVGTGADTRLIGQRVAVSSSVTCGVCGACGAGREAQCLRLQMIGIHRWGSYAELAAVPASNVRPVPAGMSFPEAAALAATGPIAFTQLKAGQVGSGTWLLVNGATGALGTTLVALGTALGARVVAMSRRPEAIPAVLHPQARLAGSDSELAARLLALTAGAGIDLVVDNVAAGADFARYYPALAVGGRIVLSGAIGTPEQTTLPVPARSLYLRSQSLLGIRTSSLRDIGAFWDVADAGFRLSDELISQLPLESAAEAHASLARNVGHLVLTTKADR